MVLCTIKTVYNYTEQCTFISISVTFNILVEKKYMRKYRNTHINYCVTKA